MSHAPIVLFVYNRPLHTRQTIDALLKNELAAESDLIIYSDAPKKPEAAQAVQQVREYLATITGFASVSIILRERNWGLANSVIDGVTSVVDRYGRVIVLEDDLLVAENFLSYMNLALDRYEGCSEVMQVSAYMFPVKTGSDHQAFFLPLTTSWGWATWKRAWECFDSSVPESQLLNSRESRKAFDLQGAYPYSDMLASQLLGKIDSWAIRWYLCVFMRKGLVLYPPRSLVENIGFDGSGTHCGKGDAAQSRTDSGLIEVEVGLFPTRVSASMPHYEAIAGYMKSSGSGGVLNKIKRIFR
ncbi:MAG: glycosyltransferase [Gallionella sp.]|nr:glycosyltransferase [Gallionella sp.]MDD4947121.1 glycosyltransferase [Gallionella sp.]MDD5611463.1 glycosyltransferase [Gallionella sp.]